MTKINTKLLVFLSLFVCSLCLCFGLAACNPNNDNNTNDPVDSGGEHTHTFGGFWLFDGAEGHYQLATCHPTVKSELEPHVDENGDLICDVCDYVMHVHVDEDEDNICDECQTVLHKHTYKDEWTFSENNHWHEATCEHFIERSDYVAHSFVNGVCECGVKESEVKVYALYKNSPEYELFFTQWLDWLESEGITVEYTDSGDGIYHYEDRDEVRFLGERTVKVNAVVDGEPLADVWFMVSMANNGTYYESNGTIALGLAKTDANGIAEITFRPVGGYTSADIEYRIRIAESRDIAKIEKIDEEAVRPIPNRYVVKGGNLGFEFKPCEVSENATGDGIAATIEFEYSIGWNAYNTIYLPYRRYWLDQVNGKGIREEGFTYEFTSSGENLFDYFYFSPQLYDYSQGGTIEQNLKIVENAQIACSGVYKISFTVEGDAAAELYYWNEDGVNLDASHQRKSDGTPSDTYLTEKCEGKEGFITVKISPALGLRLYQLGIKTDVECKVTITVERTEDFGVGADYTFDWNSETGKSELKINISQESTLMFGLNGVSEGLYVITLPQARVGTSNVGRYYIWTDDDEQKNFVFVHRWWEDVNGSTKGIIRITKNTSFIYLQNVGNAEKNINITLEEYELPTVKADEFVSVPVTPLDSRNSYTLSLSTSGGNFKLGVWIAGTENGGKDIPLTVYIGEKEYKLSEPSVYFGGYNYFYTYTGSVEVGKQDTTISFRCSTEYSFTAGVTLTTVA